MNQVKIVFVPKAHTNIVRQAMGDAGHEVKRKRILHGWSWENLKKSPLTFTRLFQRRNYDKTNPS